MILKNTFFLFLISLLGISCENNNPNQEFVAYFGGEVVNPTKNYVLLYKDQDLIDTLFLDKKNLFFKKFDSLAPGMYKFVHEPEYQYIYFDKNDSLLVRINTVMFDESVTFTGRGEKKNNFLINLFNQIENDKNNYFETFDYDFKKFNRFIDSIHLIHKKFYEKRKLNIQWNQNLDKYAQSCLNYSYYTKKEFYPVVYQMRNGKSIMDSIPNTYYDYRKNINFNDQELSNYSPFVKYLTAMLNNMAYCKSQQTEECSFINNINKLHITDSIFKNKSTKNELLKKLAYIYFIQDQDVENNHEYLKTFENLSSNKDDIKELRKISQNIKNLAFNNSLPNLDLQDIQNKIVNTKAIIQPNTVIFFWDINFHSHYLAVHKKIEKYKKSYPKYNFVAICIEENQEQWHKKIETFNTPYLINYRNYNSDSLTNKWMVNKIHRTIIIGKNGKIKNAFTSLFESNFEDELK
jgi:Thioredoxin-like